ncbi:unnamed protein product [Schistocephalus solidus]|uniref:Endo/exonuclease/phosphatase domain-containing protein n=1 Tax=Schistocephalus solidus TaxID=70667 RepID=A0A183T1W2_SCHSO|nr:unnamed protein product [Schistocephalus solidus]
MDTSSFEETDKKIADESRIHLVKEIAIHQEVLIAGEFNAPTVDGAPTSFGSKLMDLTLDQPMAKKVEIQTRFRENQRANFLDLVLTKDFSNIDEVYSIAPLGKSDHSTLLWVYSLYSQCQKRKKGKRNIWIADLNLVKEMAIHQEVLIAGDFNAPTVDGAPTSFGSKLMDLTFGQPMAQKVKISMRFIENQRANCLDLVVTKDFS